MFNLISKAFNPIIELLQGVSFPLAFITIGLGVLMIMMGQKNKGMHFIKYGVVGYLLMQFLPSLMTILHSVGTALKP